jgi:hypothetical protein
MKGKMEKGKERKKGKKEGWKDGKREREEERKERVSHDARDPTPPGAVRTTSLCHYHRM